LATLLDKLNAAVGAAHVLSGVELSPFVVEGRTPDAAVFPGSAAEIAAVVRVAAEAGVPIMPWGGGTAVDLGPPPPRAGIVLSLRRLGHLLEHEPGDLTVTAEAGMTIADLQTALRARGQWLSLDPPDAERATLGGVVAAGQVAASSLQLQAENLRMPSLTDLNHQLNAAFAGPAAVAGLSAETLLMSGALAIVALALGLTRMVKAI